MTTLFVHHRSSLAENLLFYATWLIQIKHGFCLQSYSVTPDVTHPRLRHSSTAARQMVLPFIQPFALPFHIFIESLCGVSDEIIAQLTTVYLTSFKPLFSIRFTDIYILHCCHILKCFRLVLHIYYHSPPTHPPPPTQHDDVVCAPAGLAKSSNVLITLEQQTAGHVTSFVQL
jgi:hypothetical protein